MAAAQYRSAVPRSILLILSLVKCPNFSAYLEALSISKHFKKELKLYSETIQHNANGIDEELPDIFMDIVKGLCTGKTF